MKNLLPSQKELISTATLVQLESELKAIIKYKEAVEKELESRKQ